MLRRLLPLLALAPCARGAVAAPAQVERGDALVLDSGVLRLVFARRSGELTAVDNLAAGLALLPEGGGVSPVPRVGVVGAAAPRPLAFAYEVLADDEARQALRLLWSYEDGIRVEVRAELAAGAELAYLWPRVLNDGPRGVQRLDYPRFRALRTLGERAADDVLVHPFVRGMLVRDPSSSLDLAHNPLAETLYPQAYNGMTHQLVDYYSEGLGGFFFATFDPHGTEKQLSLPLEDGVLGLGWSFLSWDERPGRDLDLGFPVVLGANTSGSWYRAADHYRAWAETAPWCAERGPLAQRPETQRARWLLEDVGLATFGTSAAVDQSAWYAAYGELVDADVLHVTGFDGLRDQGRLGDPEDVRFALHPSNVAAIERGGDGFAVFLADLRTTFLPLEIALEVGRETVAIVPRATPEACPTDRLWQHLHARRAARAVLATGAASFYCDASAANRELACASREHGHPPGRGRWMLDGYRELYAGTRAALGEACGTYTPLGIELMHEVLLDRFDYYQARNGAGFMGALEGGFYRGLQLRGLAETVPVFEYLYHDYAPVALDGCAKVSERLGDVFYWMAGRVALTGGVVELNNEFSPPERFPGTTRVGMLHYKDLEPFEWLAPGQDGDSPYDPAKGAFLRELAAARTEYGTDFLAYGRMLPPLDLPADELELGYGYYNNIDWGGRPNTTSFSSAAGTYAAPRVLHSAWSAGGRLGLFFVNLGAEATRLSLPLDPQRYAPYGLGLGGGGDGWIRGAAGSAPLALVPGAPLELQLPARRVVLVELRPR